MKNTMTNQTENAMAQGKATFEQVASKSREAIEHGMKSVDEMAGMARGNVEAMLASSRAAAQGIEAIAREVSDFARKSFEETTAAARAMTTVKTPNELMALQNDFAKTQFDAAVAEMSKLSETMVKLMGEVFEPMQARATVATDKMKSMVGSITH
jgi:phasin family protein